MSEKKKGEDLFPWFPWGLESCALGCQFMFYSGKVRRAGKAL